MMPRLTVRRCGTLDDAVRELKDRLKKAAIKFDLKSGPAPEK